MKVLSIKPPPDERILKSLTYVTDKKPFGITVTDRALHFTELNRWSLKEPWVVRRVPIEQVTHVALRRTRPLPILALAILMILSGGALTMMMLLALFENGDREPFSAWPIVLLLAGLILPFSARGHRTLRISFTSRNDYQWKPPLLVWGATRRQLNAILDEIADAAQAAGVRVVHH